MPRISYTTIDIGETSYRVPSSRLREFYNLLADVESIDPFLSLYEASKHAAALKIFTYKFGMYEV